MTNEPAAGTLSRRALLRAGVLGATAATFDVLACSRVPARQPAAAGAGSTPAARPDIQHDLGPYLAPSQTVDGTVFRFGPAYTVFLTARLTRLPGPGDRDRLAGALDTLEARVPWRPDGLFTTVAYGLPYLRRLRPGVVQAHLPRLLADPARPAFEEAIPGPTDVAAANPDVRKRRWHLPVRVERNDVLLTLRSDDVRLLAEAVAWLRGTDRLAGAAEPAPAWGGLFAWTSQRLMVNVRGMPRRLADSARLPYADRIHPDSPMWMGFADQQANSSAPAAVTTFAGTPELRRTDARPGDYLDRGAVQHLSHTLLDLRQFYLGDPPDPHGLAESYSVRAQYMFRSTPPPAAGNTDQFRDGGGPVFLPNTFQGVGDAEAGAQGLGTPEGVRRIGHLTALQRASRARDGTPLHLRVDGPGFDALDVPDRSSQPKLQFSVFVPSAETFASMRRAGAAVDLARAHRVAPNDNGLERFLTTTRRQNFLVPPRRYRAFPLLELQ